MHNQESSTINRNDNENVSSKGPGLPYRWTKYFNSMSNKLRFIILVTALIMSVFFFIMSYFLIRQYLKQEVDDDLHTLAEIKHRQIEDYFHRLKGQIILASRDEVVKEAMTEFADAFGSIESDSYELPDYADLYSMNAGLETFYSADIIPGIHRIPGM